MADDQHKLNAAEQKYKEAQTALARASEALQGTEALLFGLKVDNFYKDFESELAVRRSEISKNAASAEESYSQRDVNKQIERFKRVEANIKESGETDELNTYISDLRKQGALSESDYEKAMREIRILQTLKGNAFMRKLDESLEWIKGKVKIFGN